MPQKITLRDDGPESFQHSGGVAASQDDPVVEDVRDSLAEYLVEDAGHFEYVDDAEAEEAEEEAAEAATEPDAAGVQDGTAAAGSGTITTEDVADEAREPDHSGVRTEEVGSEEEPPMPTEDEAAAESDTQDSDAPFDPSEYTVDEFEENLQQGDYSGAELAELETAESQDEDRKGVHQALDDAREELDTDTAAQTTADDQAADAEATEEAAEPTAAGESAAEEPDRTAEEATADASQSDETVESEADTDEASE